MDETEWLTAVIALVRKQALEEAAEIAAAGVKLSPDHIVVGSKHIADSIRALVDSSSKMTENIKKTSNAVFEDLMIYGTGAVSPNGERISPRDISEKGQAANTDHKWECVNGCQSLVLKARYDNLMQALTPSVETKRAYISEFKFEVVEFDADENEIVRLITVPWTTIKEIMAAIRQYAISPETKSVE